MATRSPFSLFCALYTVENAPLHRISKEGIKVGDHTLPSYQEVEIVLARGNEVVYVAVLVPPQLFS